MVCPANDFKGDKNSSGGDFSVGKNRTYFYLIYRPHFEKYLEVKNKGL